MDSRVGSRAGRALAPVELQGLLARVAAYVWLDPGESARRERDPDAGRSLALEAAGWAVGVDAPCVADDMMREDRRRRWRRLKRRRYASRSCRRALRGRSQLGDGEQARQPGLRERAERI